MNLILINNLLQSQRMQEEYLQKDKKNDHFEYEYFLSKSRGQFQDWLNASNLIETNRAQYIQQEHRLLRQPYQKYKIMTQIRSSVLVYVLRQHLKSLIVQFKNNLMGNNQKEILTLQKELKICIQTFRTILEIGYQKSMHKQIKGLLDDIFLYVHNPFLMMELVFCIRLGHPNFSPSDKNMNVVKYDPSIPQYYDELVRLLCQKYPTKFKIQSFEVQNHSPELYISIMDKDIKQQDAKMALVIVTAKILQKRMKDPLVRTCLLTYKYIKLNILSEKVPNLKQTQQYEMLLNNLVPQASKNPEALMAVLWAQPGLFLETSNKKRKHAGFFQKWIVEQISGVEEFIQNGTINDNIIPFLLTREGMTLFLQLINEIVLYVQFIFEASTELETYGYYTRMLGFLKKCYLSFKTPKWFVPVNFLIQMENNVFEDLHVNIDKDIIEAVTEMISQLSKEQLPTWYEYSNGKIIQTPVNRLQYVSAIIFYLQQCHQQDNNFFEFAEPMPIDLATSILLIQLVNIRFHEFQPNEQQVQYYTTVLGECLKYNVSPRYNWFKGLDARLNQYDRQVEYDMIREIKNEEIKSIFQSIINTREIRHIQKCLNEGFGPIEIVNQLKYNIGLRIKISNFKIGHSDDMLVFQILTIMSSILEQGQFDLKNAADQVRLNHLQLCLSLYNTRITECKGNEQYNLIIQNLIIPWIRMDFQQAKYIRRKFQQFFMPWICSPHYLQIISNYIDFITQKPYSQIEKQLIEQTLMILEMIHLQGYKRSQLQNQQGQELGGRIISIIDPSLPEHLKCVLGLLVEFLMPASQTLQILLSDQKAIQDWFQFLEEAKKHISKQQQSGREEIIKKQQTNSLNFIFKEIEQLKISVIAAEKIIQLPIFEELCKGTKTDTQPQQMSTLSSGALIVLLASYVYNNNKEKILQIIKQISTRKEKPSNRKADLSFLVNITVENEEDQITGLGDSLRQLIQKNTSENNQKVADGFMNFMKQHLTEKSYFCLAREIGAPEYVEEIPVEIVLRVGSDNKYKFSNFICTISKLVSKISISQQVNDCFKMLQRENYQFNVGALFFLAMVVIRYRNKEIQDFIMQNLISHHIFKVKPRNLKAEAIVVQTLKAFTAVMMEEAKRLIKKCPDNIFREEREKMGQHMPVVNKLFGIIYCLPDQCLNELKLSKQTHQQIQEEQWESEKDSEDQKDKGQANNKGKEGSEDEEEPEQEEQVSEQQQNQMQENNSQWSAQFQQQDISDILLNKKAGFATYNQYIKIRQQLDVAIKGDYAWLQKAVKNKSLLDDDIQKYMAGIVATLTLLESAQKRIITKMNQQLYNALRFRGLQAQRIQDEDKNREEKEFKFKYTMFSDSQFDPNLSEESQEDSDYQSSFNEQSAMDMISQAFSQGGVEAFNFNIGNDGVINIVIPQPQPQPQQPPNQNNLNSQNIQDNQSNQNQQEPPNSDDGTNQPSSQQSNQVPGNIFSNLGSLGLPFSLAQNLVLDPQTQYMMKKQSSVEACNVELFKHQYFSSLQMDKLVEILIFKMFDFSIQEFTKYVSFYKKFATFSAGSSSFINSLILLLRLPESEQIKQNKLLSQFPILDKSFKQPTQFQSNSQIFVSNAVFLITNINFSDKNIKYIEGQPGIQVIEFIADILKLSKQPHIVSMILLAYRNIQNDTLSERIQQAMTSMSQFEESKKLTGIKYKHIEELVKSSYNNHCDVMFVPNVQEIANKRADDFLKAYLNHVAPLLLEDIKYMGERLTILEQSILNTPQKKQENIILMLEITKAYEENWSVFYYSIKDILQIIVKTYKKRYSEQKDEMINLVFQNKDLILALTISMHHINFSNQYLKKPGENPSQNVLQIVENQIRAPNLIAMVHSAASKFIIFQSSQLIETYFKNFMFKPGEYKFGSIVQVANLLLPLLDLERFCCSKFQKVILPPIFENPRLGYRLPLSFRLIDLQDDNDASQTLHITRQCSFDIAFHELKVSKFQIQYDQQQGNDQGGLRRQFMRGWTGKGVNQQFFFIGKILGIALRDQNLYGGTLDLAMTCALTGYKPDLKLVQDIDPVVYKNLAWIQQNPVQDLGLDFTRNRVYFGVQIIQELKEGGSKISVTEQNKKQYIQLYIRNLLFAGRQREMSQLKRGFYTIVSPKSISILTPQQLLIKIAGVDTIDIAQLKKNVRYEGYSEFSEVIKWFWEMVESFSEKQKQTFLHFLTGTHKIPLGLKNYDLTIERVHDTSRLPVAHTCFNTLDLPEYSTRAVFIEKVKTAIFEGHDTYSIM